MRTPEETSLTWSRLVSNPTIDPFLRDLAATLHKHQRDLLTSTPDFILAAYLSRFLDVLAEYNPQSPLAPNLESRVQGILDEMYRNRYAWMAPTETESEHEEKEGPDA